MGSLQELFEIANEWAERDPKAARLAGYIAQVINSLADSCDEVRFNEQLRELDEMIEEARAWKAKHAQEKA